MAGRWSTSDQTAENIPFVEIPSRRDGANRQSKRIKADKGGIVWI